MRLGIKTVRPSDPDSQRWDSTAQRWVAAPDVGVERPARAAPTPGTPGIGTRHPGVATENHDRSCPRGPSADLERSANYPGEPIRGLRCPDQGRRVDESPGELQIEEIVIDDPQPNEIVIRIAASGLCDSDLHWLPGPPDEKADRAGRRGAGIVERPAPTSPRCDRVTMSSPTTWEPAASVNGAAATEETAPADRDPPRPTRSTSAVATRRNGDRDVVVAAFAEQIRRHESQAVKIDNVFPSTGGAGWPRVPNCSARRPGAQGAPGATVAVIGCGGIRLNAIEGAVIAGANRSSGSMSSTASSNWRSSSARPMPSAVQR